MTKLMLVLLLALGVAAPVWAQDKTPADGKADGKEGERNEAKEDSDKPSIDYLKPYRTVGNKWTIKTTSKNAGTESISFAQYEVTEVKDDVAKYKIAHLDADGKELYASEVEISLKAPEQPVPDAPKAPEVKSSEETVKTEAGEFDCHKYEVETNGTKSTTWICKKSNLVVKSHTKGDWGESTSEVTNLKVS